MPDQRLSLLPATGAVRPMCLRRTVTDRFVAFIGAHMPAKRSPRIPSYRFHKSTNRAVVTLDGRDIFLGRYNSPESRQKYDRMINEWLGAGRQTSGCRRGADRTGAAGSLLETRGGHVSAPRRVADLGAGQLSPGAAAPQGNVRRPSRPRIRAPRTPGGPGRDGPARLVPNEHQ